ncbi:CsgG/HfaB family protein [Fervidobacterium islandicum]|uniref:CsgG/HfaB family protein n=1 Tax=Fervidobacterium islandicum TaxID=2423 RepID=UPI003A68D5A8
MRTSLSKLLVGAFLLVFLTLIFSAGGISLTEKVKLVILPGKVGSGWNMDEVDYLLAILEEQALELGRFQLFPRADLSQIMKERNMSEFGVSEALQIGKLGGSKYALLLTLTELSSSWSSQSKAYIAVSRYTIKLYNIEDGSLLASKTLESEGSSKDSAQKAISEALRTTANDIWYELRQIFKLEAYVISVSGNSVVLAGVDPKIVKKGYIFQIETSTGEIGYVKVVGYNKSEGTVITTFMYGAMPSEYDVATEFPVMPFKGGIGLGMFSNYFGLGISAWGSTEEIPLPLYIGVGTFLGSIAGYTPVYLNMGAGLNILEMGRITVGMNGGLSLIGLVDLDTFESLSYIFGAFGGALVTYEFNPRMGVYGSVGYSLYLGTNGPTGIVFQLGMYF